MKILILDDEPKSALLAKILLERLVDNVSEVCIVHDFESCSTQLKTDIPDLFLTDVEVNGQSVFDFLNQIGPLDFPIMITSASKKYAFEAYEYGLQAYLLKPLDESELFRALQRLKAVFHWKDHFRHLSV